MRLILVPTSNRPESVLALDTAFRLAGSLDANVAGCHIRRERFETSTTLQLMPDVDYGKVIFAEPKMNLDSRMARKTFKRVAGERGFELAKAARVGLRRRAFWHELVGTPARLFAIAGPIADLVVVARPEPKSAGPAKAFLLAALLHSARTVLILPQRPVPDVGRRVLIAWNQSAEAAVAAFSVIPLLQRAERVAIVSAGAENRSGPKSSHLAQYLSNWDVRVERVRTKGRDVARELEGVYRDSDSDLIVMGAYSRHRLSELVFGGVTEHMLFRTRIPVAMLHR